MKTNYLTIALIFVASGIYAQSNIHESGGNIGIGTTSPLEKLTIANEQPNALGLYRDLDVGVVGPAGISLNFGAKNGSAFAPGAQIAGILDNPASTGWMTFSTLNAGSLSEKMRITKEGNVGVGTQNPGSRKFKLVTSAEENDVGVEVEIGRNTGTNYGVVGKATGIGANTNIGLFTAATGAAANLGLRIYNVLSGVGNYAVYSDSPAQSYFEGNIGIGTTDTKGYKLAVTGKVRAQEIKVEALPWPDFVFAKDYQLPTLQETEKHIKDKGHLPGIPSATEVKTNGIDLGEMNAKLLQKIEELTLHLIEMKKESIQDKTDIRELKALTDKLRLEINQIKTKR